MITTRKIILCSFGCILLTGSAAATPVDNSASILRYAPLHATPSVNSWIKAPALHNSLQLAQQEKFPPMGFDPSHPDRSYKQPEMLPSWPQSSPASKEIKPPAFALPKPAQPGGAPSAMTAFPPSPSNRIYGNNTIKPAPDRAAPKAKTGFAAAPQPGGVYGYPFPAPPAPAWGQPGVNPWARPNLDTQRPYAQRPYVQPRARANPWQGTPAAPAVNARRNPWAPPPAPDARNNWGQNAFNRAGRQPAAPPLYAPWPPKTSAPANVYNYGYPPQFRSNNRRNAANNEPGRFNRAYPGFGWGGGPWGGLPW